MIEIYVWRLQITEVTDCEICNSTITDTHIRAPRSGAVRSVCVNIVQGSFTGKYSKCFVFPKCLHIIDLNYKTNALSKGSRAGTIRLTTVNYFSIMTWLNIIVQEHYTSMSYYHSWNSLTRNTFKLLKCEDHCYTTTYLLSTK